MRDFFVKIAVKLGFYEPIVNILNRHIEKKEAKAVKARGLEVLQLVDDILSKRGVKPFFCFGLLLGAYRDKGFIPYDYDLDIGMLASERPDNILEIMKENGFELWKQSYLEDDKRITVEQFKYQDVPVDFYYFFDIDENTIATIVPFRHEYKDWKEANRTDGFPSVMVPLKRTTFSRYDFLGKKFYLPDCAHEWLTDIYGENYMTPVKNWSFEGVKTCRQSYPVRQYRNLELVEQLKKKNNK